MHCPVCAAFDRWAKVWAERRGDFVGELYVDPPPEEQAEQARLQAEDFEGYRGWLHARIAVFVMGTTDPKLLDEAREACCRDARELRRGPTPPIT